ncbi:MAG: hypothetical protein WA434_02970 [Candidatus Acidiferrales bacterium]
MEYKLISGTDEEINKKLAEDSKEGWNPLMMSSVLTESVVRSQVMLGRVSRAKD